MMAVTAAFLSAQSLLTYAQPLERPVGCHGHGGQAPSPGTRNPQCCITGHNQAVLSACQTTEPLLREAPAEFVVRFSLRSLATVGWAQPTLSYGDPPNRTPLRI
jgi:hypothetical protein